MSRRWLNIVLPSYNTLHSARKAAKNAWPWHTMGRERVCIPEYYKTYYCASPRLEPAVPNYEDHVTTPFWSSIHISFHAFIEIVCTYCRIKCFTHNYLIFAPVLRLSLWLWLVTGGLVIHEHSSVTVETVCYHQLIWGRNMIYTTLSLSCPVNCLYN